MQGLITTWSALRMVASNSQRALKARDIFLAKLRPPRLGMEGLATPSSAEIPVGCSGCHRLSTYVAANCGLRRALSEASR